MHGPQAARIMREELNYRGAIIGSMLYASLSVTLSYRSK